MHAPYGKVERFGPRQRASTAAGTFLTATASSGGTPRLMLGSIGRSPQRH